MIKPITDFQYKDAIRGATPLNFNGYGTIMGSRCGHVRIKFMMTSSNGNIFRVTGPLCGEFTGLRWIPHTKASDAEIWYFLWFAHWINSWVNNREAGDLRRNHVHYDVIVMFYGLVVPYDNIECGQHRLKLSDGTKPLPEPMFTHYHWSPVTITWGQFYNEYFNHQLTNLARH